MVEGKRDPADEARQQLSLAQQRIRDLEAENAVLAQRAALAVTQEADAKQAARATEADWQRCYRCGHAPAAPNLTCVCCQHDHTPSADGSFGTG